MPVKYTVLKSVVAYPNGTLKRTYVKGEELEFVSNDPEASFLLVREIIAPKKAKEVKPSVAKKETKPSKKIKSEK